MEEARQDIVHQVSVHDGFGADRLVFTGTARFGVESIREFTNIFTFVCWYPH